MNIENLKKKIDEMSQVEMARLWRFTPLHKHMFTSNKQDDLKLQEYLAKKLKEKGGMTPQISKSIGWEQ